MSTVLILAASGTVGSELSPAFSAPPATQADARPVVPPAKDKYTWIS